MAKPIRRCTSVDETVLISTSSVKWKLLKDLINLSPKELPTMQIPPELKIRLSEMRKILIRRRSTGDLQESSNSTSEDLRGFLQERTEKESSIYVSLQKLKQTKEMYEDGSLKTLIESIYEILEKLSEDVKGIQRTLRHQNSSSKGSRLSSKLGKKTMAWRGRSKRGQKQRESRSERDDENKQNKGENVDLFLRLLLMVMNIKGDPLKYIKMEDRTRTKSELMSLEHDRKDSLFVDAFDGTVAKTRMQDGHRNNLLESFMYKDYHNGFSAAAKTKEVRPLIAFSRNIDEYVAKELHSSPSTRQSEGASRSRSYDLRSSESLHSMNLELIRLETFKSFPASRTISTIKLAKEGFYYSGHDDQVICFSCGLEKSGWRVNDDPREIHRQQSPNCPFIQAQSVNVPVGESSNSQGPENVDQNAQQNATNLNSTGNGTPSQGTEEATSSENLPSPSTPERDHIALPPVRNVETAHVQRDPVTEPQNTEETRYEENSTNQQVQSSAINYSARKTQEKINAFLRNLDPLGINFDRPKYPAYAVLATRVSSYQGWPASLTQQPRDLGTAGFFYVGYGDYTRCFFCGGGLRNWEPGDDPWTEHARWFPKCAFVRQNKGDEFVALVQIKHQELEERESMGAGSCATSAEHNGEVPNGMVPFDISTLPSFQSVQEMGYSVESIKAAFQELRGTKNPEDITGIDIMDVILSKEDRNNGLDIPPQTPDVSHQTGLENQNRNLNGSQSNSGTSAPSSQNEVKGAASELLASANDKEEKKKDQRKEKSAAVSTDEEKLDSLNNALAPMSLEDTRSLLEENRQLRELRMCKICMENEASIAMLPCGHLCCCTDCAPAMRKCPICRQFVKGTVRTWLA